jgi:hypothetical protein
MSVSSSEQIARKMAGFPSTKGSSCFGLDKRSEKGSSALVPNLDSFSRSEKRTCHSHGRRFPEESETVLPCISTVDISHVPVSAEVGADDVGQEPEEAVLLLTHVVHDQQP